MTTLKDELAALDLMSRDIEKRKAEIYQISLAAPDSEKVCSDLLAELKADGRGTRPMPLTLHGLTFSSDPNAYEPGRMAGAWVAVRPCRKEGPDKTYLGVNVGEVALSMRSSFHEPTGVLEVRRMMLNPAMWVPELKRVVFGMESWWRRLSRPEDLAQISDADIDSVFYVRALKELTESATTQPPAPSPAPAKPVAAAPAQAPEDEIKGLREQFATLARRARTLQEELTKQRANNEARNRALDALHYVWCNGGCEKGVHRHGEHPPLTDELVAEAARNTNRMIGWLGNARFKTLPIEARYDHLSAMRRMSEQHAQALSEARVEARALGAQRARAIIEQNADLAPADLAEKVAEALLAP